MENIEVDEETLERFAIQVEHLPDIYAQERYEELIAEEKHWLANQQEQK